MTDRDLVLNAPHRVIARLQEENAQLRAENERLQALVDPVRASTKGYLAALSDAFHFMGYLVALSDAFHFMRQSGFEFQAVKLRELHMLLAVENPALADPRLQEENNQLRVFIDSTLDLREIIRRAAENGLRMAQGEERPVNDFIDVFQHILDDLGRIAPGGFIRT